MDILLIGNGFDLAHNLPTRYIDFLEFLKFINAPNSYWVDANKKLLYTCTYGNIGDSQIKIIDGFEYIEKKENVEVVEKIKTYSNNNVWYKYFQTLEANNIVNWHNVENEIERVVKQLELFEKTLVEQKRLTDLNINQNFLSKTAYLYLKRNYDNFEISQNEIYFDWHQGYGYEQRLNVNFSIDKKDNYTIRNSIKTSTINLTKLIKFIIDELNAFTKCFELYLMHFVQTIELKTDSHIKDIICNISDSINVINFNYTDYIEKICKDLVKIDMCYIHGKGIDDIDNEEDNLILGMDENNLTNIAPSFVAFRKYFQRFIKKSDSKYYDWLMEIRKDEEKKQIHNLHIIGHSLTPSDKQILHSLITLKNVKTTIYYREEDKYKLAQNLAIILGFEKFTEFTSGSGENIKITFKNLYRQKNKPSQT